MRSRWMPVLCLPLLSAACSLPASTAAPSPSQPLRAWLAPATQTGPAGFSISVSRPAHVAVFEIIPGRGAVMLYPYGSATAGEPLLTGTTIWPALHQRLRWSHLPVLVSHSFVLEPRFYLLLASEEPLRLENYATNPWSLRTALHARNVSSVIFSPYRLMQELVDLVVPSWEMEGTWVADIHVQWPEIPHRREPVLARAVTVNCPGGGHVLWSIGGPSPVDLCGEYAEPPPPADNGNGEQPEQPDRRRPDRDGQDGAEGGAVAASGEAGVSPAPRARATPPRESDGDRGPAVGLTSHPLPSHTRPSIGSMAVGAEPGSDRITREEGMARSLPDLRRPGQRGPDAASAAGTGRGSQPVPANRAGPRSLHGSQSSSGSASATSSTSSTSSGQSTTAAPPPPTPSPRASESPSPTPSASGPSTPPKPTRSAD